MSERTPKQVDVIHELIAFPYADDRLIANQTYGLSEKDLQFVMEKSKLPMRLMLPIPESEYSPRKFHPHRVHAGPYPFVQCGGNAEGFFRQYLRHNYQIRFDMGSEFHQLPETVRHFLDKLKMDPDNPRIYEQPPQVSLDFRTEEQIKTDPSLQELMMVCGFDRRQSRDITGETHTIEHDIDPKELATLIEKATRPIIPVGWNGGSRDPQYRYGNYFKIHPLYLTRVSEGLWAGLLRPASWNGGYRDFGVTFNMDPKTRAAS